MTPKLFEEWDEEVIISYLKSEIFLRGRFKNSNANKKWCDEGLAIRRMYVLDLFKRGMSIPAVKHYLQEKLGVKKEAARRYVLDALDYLVDDNEQSVEHYRAIARTRLEGMIETCLATNNMKSALGASDQLNKINGLYTEKHEIKGDAVISFEFGQDS